MQDLHVTEVLPQMITLTEAYIQVSKFYLEINRAKRCVIIPDL